MASSKLRTHTMGRTGPKTSSCITGDWGSTSVKVGRPFRYDLNKILYDYTVEVRNRFKGLDLIDECLKNYGQRFMTLYKGL